MPIKNLTLGLVLAMAGSALAQSTTYKVRNGDNDDAIAHRWHINIRQLHRANASVDWDNLQIGTRIHVPSAAHYVGASTSRHQGQTSGRHHYTIRDGDNDWSIAHRAHITTTELRHLNPDVRWARIQPGQEIWITYGTGHRSPETASRGSIHSRYAAINNDNVMIRSRATRSSDSLGTVDTGTRVAVLDHDGSWYRVKFPHGTVGWVRSDFLRAASSPKVAHHRRRRSSGSSHLASHRTRRRHRNSGLVASSSDFAGSEVVQKAARLQGVRYRWGMASRSGTDCSGLSTQAYRAIGVKLPRTSGEQSHVGVHVSRDKMKSGDLVFFKTGRSHRINHVGIYMGNGKFIHASSGGGKVQVNSLDEGYYKSRFATARRVAKKK